MKKILSILLCIVLVCSIGTFSVSAATNYCNLFQGQIRALRWSLNFYENDSFAEGQSFPTEVIIDFIKMKTMNDYVDDNGEYSYIPASVFEDKAKKCFAIVDVNALRSFEENYWNNENQAMDKRKIYDSAKNAYVFVAAGGKGDSTTYVIRGYVKSGNKYTVYSHFVDLAGVEMQAGAVEGKDYIVVDGVKCKIEHILKNVVETDGTDVKFHSWQRVSAVPEVSGMVTPSTKVEDDKPVESKPTESKPTESKPTESKPTESKPTASKPTESRPAENTTSSQAPTSSEESSTPEDTKPLVTVVQTETAKLETEENVFPEDTVVKVEEIKETEAINTIKVALKEVSEKFVAYEITAECKNVAVQPDGKVKATFDIPDGYDLDKVAVFYVADDGTTEKLASSVDKGNKTIVAELSHFSTYVVAETNTVQTTPEESETPDVDENGNPEKKSGALLWVIIAVAVVVVAGGGVACFFVFKKKA